ncbi:MAG: HEAT repeat domain-containing protein [Pseudomonadota bacterium]
MNLPEAAARADELARAGDARQLSDLRREWDDEVEAAARDGDYRVRAIAYRALGQFRYREKRELLRRGLEDESPVARGAALLSLELLARDRPGDVNDARGLLHELVSHDPNGAVRRLAIAALRHGSPERHTIVLLQGLADDDDADRELRATAARVAAELTKKSRAR